MVATAPGISLHKPEWSNRDYVAYRLNLVVDELRRFPALEELDELGRFSDPVITERSGFTDIADAIRANGYDLSVIYDELGGESCLAAKEVGFPAPHQLAAVVMLGEKKRMLVYDQFRTGKTAIGVIAKPYLEMNVLNSLTPEQKKAWQEISAMPWSAERQGLEEILYNDIAKVKAPTLVIAPNSVKAQWRQKVEGYLGVQQTIVNIYSNAIVIEKTRTGEQTVLRGNRLSDLKSALSLNPDYVIVSYNMVFRTTASLKDPETREAIEQKVAEYRASGIGKPEAHARLVMQVGKKRADAILGNGAGLETLLKKAAEAEVRAEAEHVFEILGGHNFKLLVADEVDNARAKRALSASAVRKIANRVEYFLPMSGSPAPNKVIPDLAMLAAMIDPERYDVEEHPDTAVPFGTAYAQHPELVRNFVLLHSKPPTKTSDLGIQMPEVDEQDAVIELEGLHREVYEAIRKDKETELNQKLWHLRFALADPRLAHPDYYPGNENMRERLRAIFRSRPELLARLEKEGNASCTYAKLDEIVMEAVRRGDKFVIFTTLKEGVTDELKARYEAIGLSMLKLDGDIEAGSDEYLSDREKMRLDFQTNPERHGMIINSVVKQGISLDAANVVATIDRPFDPGSDRQLVARVQGRYQGKKVYIRHITAANTIARGVESMLLDKQLLIDLVFSGHELTPEQRRRLEERNFTRHPDIVESINPKDILNALIKRMAGRGYFANLAFLTADGGLNAQRYAESNEYDWEHSYSAQTNRLILKVVEPLVRSGLVTLDEVLDAPSGNFALARTILAESKLQFGRVTNVDFNKYQLDYGRRATAKLLEGIKGNARKKRLELEAVEGALHDLSFAPDATHNLTVCSLGIHYGTPRTLIEDIVDGEIRKREFRERELIARQLVRTTKKDGHMMFTIPTSHVDAEGAEKFTEAMERLGVEGIAGLSGVVRATKPAESTFETYLWVGRKQEAVQNVVLPSDAFVLNVSAGYSYPRSRNGNGTHVSDFSQEVCTEFEFKEHRAPVEEIAKGYVKSQQKRIISEEQIGELRRKINAQTTQLGVDLKAQFLEALDTIEAAPDRLPGQRRMLSQLADRARTKPLPATLRERLETLLAELGRL